MHTDQIYIARDRKSGMHVLVRILAVDDIGVDYPPIDPDNFNKLMMARDVKSLVLAARDLEPLSTLNKKALTEVTSVLVSIDGRRHSVQTAIDIYCESLRRAVELKDADQLLLPDIIGLECETGEEKRAKGKV